MTNNEEAEKLEAMANRLTFTADIDLLEEHAYEASKMLRQLAAEKRKATCTCGSPCTLGVVHREILPCYVYMQPDIPPYFGHALQYAVTNQRQVGEDIESEGHGSVNLTEWKNITNSTNDPFSWIERYDVLLIWIIIALLIFILSLTGPTAMIVQSPPPDVHAFWKGMAAAVSVELFVLVLVYWFVH